ncbi:MAG: shikimate dehydrogenase [Fimbriimonadaceae bacterium]|nr:shikimate dehydrogenase [Fimbriimonadaceae bacterium]
MHRFAFVVHPLVARDALVKFPALRFLPDFALEAMLKRKSPGIMSHITGIRSKTGAETEGWFIGCPLTSKQLVRLDPGFVVERLAECAQIAHGLGAEVMGLGAFTSVAGDGGVTLATKTPVKITTGNSYTVATAIEATIKACEMVGLDPSHATLAVVGATGSIGRTCAEALGPLFQRTLLVGRDLAKTQALAPEVPRSEATTEVGRVAEAEVIVTVTSSETPVLQPKHFRPGAIVCDVARPRDVSVAVAKERSDVLVIEGGVVRVPGSVEFGFDFGFPPGTAYACMAETMMLALDGRIESFTLGKTVSLEQVRTTQAMAAKHGFELAGFRSFEREVEPAMIDRARRARQSLATAT